MGQRMFGILTVWIASENGGHGYIDNASGRYFVHRRFIRSGDPRPGASAVFSVLPPANAEAKYPRAIDVVINANTEAAKQTKIPAKPDISPNRSVVSVVDVSGAVAILSGTEERVKNI
jgi:hypothetical protein